jgi:hypothetical protein
MKAIIPILCATTVLASVYAYRQREWALKLHAQLVETNKDDMTLMRIMSAEEKETVCRELREQGEIRIADWIHERYGTN